jgi:hypothetical protein
MRFEMASNVQRECGESADLHSVPFQAVLIRGRCHWQHQALTVLTENLVSD